MNTYVVVPVRLRLLPTVKRGRANGYRSTCIIGGVSFPDGAERVGFELQLLDADVIAPGETRQCHLLFWAGDFLPDEIPVGTEIRLLDGHHEVGVGQVDGQPARYEWIDEQWVAVRELS